MKKAISFLLVLLMLIPLLAGCSKTVPAGSADHPDRDTASETEESVPETDAYGREMAAYPLERGLDFKGYKIRILSRDDPQYSTDFGVDELNGDLVNDAVYNRNLTVESELNVSLERILAEGTNMSVSDMILTNVKAGDTAYDIAALYLLYGTAPSLAGAFKNLHNLPNVDFSHPWWNRSFAEELTYDGKLYYSVSDMNVSMTATLEGIFFNQDRFTDYYGDPSVLYDTVRAGNWTKDEFKRYLNGTYVDLDGDGKKDGNDFVGFALVEDNIGPWVQGFDIRICTKDGDGVPQLTYFSEKSVDAHEWLFDLFLKNEDVYFAPKYTPYLDIFKNDHAIFTVTSFYTASTQLRDMESTYGVLPMPKYNELQSGYYNGLSDGTNITGVIVNTKDPDAVGAAMELLSYYSYLNVTPAYFEVAMKSKYFRDADSAEMFDIIRDGVILDFGVVYSLDIAGGRYGDTVPCVMTRNLIRRGIRDIATTYKRCERAWQRSLDKVLNTYQDLNA